MSGFFRYKRLCEGKGAQGQIRDESSRKSECRRGEKVIKLKPDKAFNVLKWSTFVTP